MVRFAEYFDAPLFVEQLINDDEEELVALVRAPNLCQFVLEAMVTLAHLTVEADPEPCLTAVIQLSNLLFEMRPELRNKSVNKAMQFSLTMAIKRRLKIMKMSSGLETASKHQNISVKNKLLIQIWKNQPKQDVSNAFIAQY